MTRPQDRIRARVSFIAVLVAFLGISAGVLAMRQKEMLHDLEQRHALKELELIGTLAREALIKRDYATVVQFLHSWGIDNPDIASIEATATNGYRLALYERDLAAVNTFTASRDIFHAGRKLVSIKIAKDLAGVDRRLNVLFLQGAVAFLIFAVAMGAALWFTLRRTAIIPMEEHLMEIQNLNRGLESRVEDRTADIVAMNRELKAEMRERLKVEEELRRSKAELEQQNVQLKRIDAMKDGFVRDLSHELKTPVAKHLMQLEMLGGILSGRDAVDSVREILEVMELGIRRQQATIGNILVMSRLEEGGRKPDLAPVRIDALVEEVVDDYRYAISAYGVDLQMDLSPVTVKTDRELLWHVFGNIVDNAVKYRSHRNPQLRICFDRKGAGVMVVFRDNGVGFDTDGVKRAFDRFYQSSASREGVGLGLNIARTIVERLGGTIELTSEGKGKGSSFMVELPVRGAREPGRAGRLEEEKS